MRWNPGSPGAWEPDLFAVALKLGGQRRVRDNAKLALPGVKASVRKRVRGSAQSECSNSSEWAALALLRSGWSRSAPRMLVKYDQPQVELELETGRGLIFSGAWDVELEIAGGAAPRTVTLKVEHRVTGSVTDAATGKPVIGGRNGGVPEAVAEDDTGLLIEGSDPAELAAAIVRLGASPDLRQRLGRAGRKRVLEHFTWHSAAAAVLALHDKIAGVVA